MRKIGIIEDRNDAKVFSNFLNHNKIGHELREDDGGEGVWVYDEDHLRDAEKYLKEFAANPDDARFTSLKPAEAVTLQQRSENYVDVRTQVWGRKDQAKSPGLTVAVIAFCTILMFMAKSEAGYEVIRLFYFSEYVNRRDFFEITNGQVWRLLTPVFLHGGWIHLIFNMMWFHQLGGSIEIIQSRRFLVVFFLIVSVLINIAQYLVSGPAFVGMSGTIYALLGYVWMMSKYKPTSGYRIEQQVIVMMVVWLFICWFGFIANVANTSHVVGFVLGIAFGFLYAGGPSAVRRKKEFQDKLK